MAEFNPHSGYSFESSEPRKEDSNAKKKDDKRSSFSAPKPAARFNQVGDTPVRRPKEAFLLGGDALKSAGLFEHDKPGSPKSDNAELHSGELHSRVAPGAERPDMQAPRAENSDHPKPESQHAERREQSELQELSPEQFAAMAAAEAQAQIQLQEMARAEADETDDKDGKKDGKKIKPKTDAAKAAEPAEPPREKPATTPEPEPSRTESLEEMLAREMPAEFTEAVSGAELTNEAGPNASTTQELPAASENIESQLAEHDETDATLQAVQEHLENQPRAEASEPQQTPETREFQRFVGQHPELGDIAAPLTAEALAAAAEPSASSEHNSDDDTFRQMAHAESGEDPGRATFHDVAPGEPPLDSGNGGANRPPNYPPTAEGGDWGNSAWEMPAGGLAGPAALAGVGALEARRHMDNLRHTTAELTLAAGEAALTAGVAILGVGLVLEHFRAKHREKKLQKQITKQGEGLRHTNQTLQQEQLAHNRTRKRLDNLSTSQATTNEQLRRASEHTVPLAAAEAAAGATLISAAAATELARRVEHKAAAPGATGSDHELAHSLRNSRELGRAIKRNPELRDALQTQTVGSAELAGVAAAAEAGIQATHDLRERVDATEAADAIPRERNFEHLQTEPTDNSGGARQSGGADVAGHTPTQTIIHQTASAPIATQSASQLNVPTDRPHTHRSKISKPVAAAATGLLILGIALIVAFG